MRPCIAFQLAAVCLLLSVAEGMIIAPKSRCLCRDSGVKFIPKQNIKKIEVYYPSSSCQKTEVIATVRNEEGRKCLNPESKFVQNLVKNSQITRRSSKNIGA